MRFLFDDQQRSFAESVRTLLSRECDATTVRAEWEGAPRSVQRWQRLAGAGLCGVLLDGLTEVDAALALEETGRFALPDPIVESALVAAPLLGESGGRVAVQLTQRGRYCVDADQAEVLLLQHGEELHHLHPSQVCMTAQPSLDAGRRVFSVEWEPAAATQVTG